MVETILTDALVAAVVVVIGNIILRVMERRAAVNDREDDKFRQRVEEQEKEQELLKDGVQALLHDRLYSACKESLDAGYIKVDELSNLEYLYNSYHALGGNSTGTELYERAKQLPLKSVEKGG